MERSHKFITCEQCLSRKSSLFESFSGEELALLNSKKVCSYYRKNQPLFVEDSIPRGVFCINEGKVKVFSRGSEGKEQIIRVAKNGDVLGFRAMFSGDPYAVSATTLEESNICFIGKNDFLQLIDTNTTLRDGIMKELSTELAKRALFIKDLAQKTVRERLAAILLILDDVYEHDFINMTREDLSNFIGTATENLIRTLKDFKEEELINTQARKIKILDHDGLLRATGS